MWAKEVGKNAQNKLCWILVNNNVENIHKAYLYPCLALPTVSSCNTIIVVINQKTLIHLCTFLHFLINSYQIIARDTLHRCVVPEFH